jgi:hypothetical protein
MSDSKLLTKTVPPAVALSAAPATCSGFLPGPLLADPGLHGFDCPGHYCFLPAKNARRVGPVASLESA